jgi:beta-lactam-binding protein with PASTA domain
MSKKSAKQQTFVFVFENSEDRESHQVKADNLETAIEKLATKLGKRGFSDDPNDYRDDVNSGNITVHTPS